MARHLAPSRSRLDPVALTVLLACLVLVGWALLTWQAGAQVAATTSTTDRGAAQPFSTTDDSPFAAGSPALSRSGQDPASPASAGTGAPRTSVPVGPGPASVGSGDRPVLPAPEASPADLGSVQRAAEAAGAEAAASAPVRVRVDAVGIDTTVDPVGIAPDGQLEIPDDARRTGWYRFGPAPGQEGSAVLAGHVDDWLGRPGGLAALHDVAPGTEVEVRHADGSGTAYRIETVTRVPKAELDLTSLFRRDGDPVLVLVTCTGEWSGERYEDNLVVTAVPSGR